MLNRIRHSLTMIGIGAGVMYYLDPDVGKRRRSKARDQLTHGWRITRRATDVTLRDIENRIYGYVCELRALIRGRDTSDEIVADRVRSKMGHYISHPASVVVHVRDGTVTLSGLALAAEIEGFLRALRSVDGVCAVHNLIDVRPSAEYVSSLQGGVRRTGERIEWMQANWSPATRFVAGTFGGLLMMNCIAKRTPAAMLAGTFGFGLFIRAIANQPLAELGARHQRQQRIMTGKTGARVRAPAGSNTPQGDHIKTASTIARNYQSDGENLNEASMESFPNSSEPR
jgi:hypothetical protein